MEVISSNPKLEPDPEPRLIFSFHSFWSWFFFFAPGKNPLTGENQGFRPLADPKNSAQKE